MAATYFTLPLFARAKQHREELAKSNPKTPVLNDEDERFLNRVSSLDQEGKVVDQTRISDNGLAAETDKPADTTHVAVADLDSMADDPPESVPEDEPTPALPPRPRSKKTNFVELPSQEEAEAATKGFMTNTQAARSDEKKTWASYLPSVPSLTKSPVAKDQGDARTWTEYASTMVPTLPPSWYKSKDAKSEPVFNEDGSINEEATKEKEEKEVSVLLDNLNLSSINNRVFAFGEESQKFYGRFVQALKDTMNGVPTAYDDMEKLMKEAGPQIEKHWAAMPPFVQTLVKSLPAKLSAVVAPEVLAVMSEKPGNDAKIMEAATGKAGKGSEKTNKKKRQLIPSFKGLIKRQGLAATLLRNISTFLKTRFPILMGGAAAANVLMSLSVFVLMLVFYYCWKRGREVRLSKEAESVDGTDDQQDDMEVDVTDEEAADETITGSSSSEKA